MLSFTCHFFQLMHTQPTCLSRITRMRHAERIASDLGHGRERKNKQFQDTIYATNSYGIGSTSSGSFPFVLTKCPLRGAAGSRLQMTFSPFSRASLFFLSFSFTRRRKSSRQREWCTCSMRTLMRLGMMRFLKKKRKNISRAIFYSQIYSTEVLLL